MPVEIVLAQRTAELFSALSDPNRVRIISALLDQDEMNVSAIAQSLEMSESAVSHQLRGLRQMHLVQSRRDGRQIFYRLDDQHVADLLEEGMQHARHGWEIEGS